MNNPYAMPGQMQQYLLQKIEQANPAEQMVMLFEGAIKFCLQAKEAIGRNDIEARYNANRRVVEIVSYDMKNGGEVAQRLMRIYSFLLQRLMEVDFSNSAAICDEVVGHLRLLKGSWEQLARQANANVASGAVAGSVAAGAVVQPFAPVAGYGVAAPAEEAPLRRSAVA
ncbi:MAG: flagellar export chaperone FliS [Proteobacteria bacterium]|nr:flagellar export chaperone FliS [Pseudomonadota bacterium]